MAEYQNLDLEVSDYIATIGLNRPPVNALSMGLYRDIASVFGEIAGRTDEIRVAILTGTGRCFCAGRDLKVAEVEPPETRSAAAKASYSAIFHSVVPVIAAINGPAMGAGFLSAMMTDFLIASERAEFGLPEIDAGLNMSIATLLRGFNQFQARYYGFTAERVGPEEMYRIGVVQKVVPHDELLTEARRIGAVLATKSPMALRAAKWSSIEIETMFQNFEQAYRAIESRVSMGLLNTEDRKEAGKAFAEKRAPVFKNR
jgi:enoyl-CoA hydratase